MKRIWITITLLISAISIVTAQPLPDFKVVNLHNNAVITKDQLKNKVVLFNFWTFDNEGRTQLKALAQLDKKYKSKLFIIAACMDKYEASYIQQYAQKEGINFAIAKVSRSFKAWSMLKETPFSFIVDPKGNIQYVAIGYKSRSQLENMIAPYLSQADTRPVLPVLPEKVVKPDPEPQPQPTVNNNKNYSITLYGRPSCGNCKRMKSDLEKAGLKYKELNVDTDRTALNYMWQQLREQGAASGRVLLPIMDVNGYFLVNPKMDELDKYLNMPDRKPAKTVLIPFKGQIPISPAKGKVGRKFLDKISSQSYILTGFKVWYDDEKINGLDAQYSQVYSDNKISDRYHNKRYVVGHETGKFKLLVKKGYYVAGIRSCEGEIDGVTVTKKLAVMWKKWGDDTAPMLVSEYYGSQKDSDVCIEIMPEPGTKAVGIWGYHMQDTKTLNQVSLLIGELVIE